MTEEQQHTFDMKRDELTPATKSYADNLSAQLDSEVKGAGYGDLGEYVETLSTQDLKRVHALVKKLEFIREKGELPFFDESYKQKLEDLLKRFDEAYGRYLEPDAPQVKERWLNNEVIKLPLIDPEEFKQNSRLLNSLLRVEGDKDCIRGYMGTIIGLIFNRSLSRLSPEERGEIYQEIDVTDWQGEVYQLGYKNIGGAIRIIGNAGHYLGIGAIGGQIIADRAESRVGYQMRGGEIWVDNAGYGMGELSVGGKIYIKGQVKNSDIGSNCGAQIFARGRRFN